jgi:hypothetical protein
MNTKHTPGPWVVKNSGESNYFTIADSQANWLMQIQHNGEQYAVVQDANARLIAAAPELLESLIYFCENIELSKLNVRKDFSLLNAHAGALKAIRKAKGLEQ